MENNREQIMTELTRVLVEMFEVDEDDVVPEARLYEDLDIDSIDAIDMVIRLKEITGKKVSPEDFKSVRTVEDVVEATMKLLES